MEQELNVLNCIIKKKRKYFNKVLVKKHESFSKSSEQAKQAKNGADGIFTTLDAQDSMGFYHLLSFKHYCYSIQLAPAKSEQLAIGYERISAVLFDTGMYKDCISNINCSIEITESDELKNNLIQRKIECLKKLRAVGNARGFEDFENEIIKADGSAISENIPSASSNAEVKVNYSLEKNNFNSFSIEFNEKLGRYLEVTRDFYPGEIIFVEKPYCIFNNTLTCNINCNYCLTTAFSGITCEFCYWAIFCSKECKKKAWDLHHKIECSVIPLVELNYKFSYIKLALRAVIISVEEAGGISALREQLRTLDESSEPCLKEFFNDGNFRNSINFIYCFNSKLPSLCSKILIKEITYIVLFLIAIVKCTNMIDNLASENIDDWLKNEDFRFMACLILKLTILIRQKKCGFQIFNPAKECKFGNSFKKCNNVLCCSRGVCLAPITSLVHHDFIPNATKWFTETNEIIVSASQPIKKGERIFVSWSRCNTELEE